MYFRFLGEILMPNILYIDDKHRDILVLHAVNQQDPALDEILRTNACIPATPTGKVTSSSGGSIISQRDGAPTPKVGAPMSYLTNFFPKTA